MEASAGRQIVAHGRHKIDKVIGKGSFSCVFKANCHAPGATYDLCAIKSISLRQTHQRKRANHEVKVLRKLQHPNVVVFYEDFNTEQFKHIVLEHCAFGDLETYIVSKHKLFEPLVKTVMQNLSAAIKYMEAHKICHMDIKPHNVLISSLVPPVFKLTDFGIAEIMTHLNCDKFRDNGTPLYMAPEKLLNLPFDNRSDLWSLGIVMYQCLFGRPDYFKFTTAMIKTAMASETLITIPPSPSTVSTECIDLLKKLLTYDQNMRIKFSEFYIHTFLEQRITGDEMIPVISEMSSKAVALDKSGRLIEAYACYKDTCDLITKYLDVETDAKQRERMTNSNESYRVRCTDIEAAIRSKFKIGFKEYIEFMNGMMTHYARTSPKLADAITLAKEADKMLFDGENMTQIYNAYVKALAAVLPLSKVEPNGIRKYLLLFQCERWVSVAEDIQKTLL